MAKVEHSIICYDLEPGSTYPPTLDATTYMFEENDRWLPAFIFNNFGVIGMEALGRTYRRVREFHIDAE